MVNEGVAKCFGCNNWFELIATEAVGTIQEGDVRVTQRWCVGCLMAIKDNTVAVIEINSEYPPGTEPWDNEDELEPEKDSGEED